MGDAAAPVPIGRLLGQEAARRGITQATAAAEIGVSQATFSRWVAGGNPPTTRYRAPIARFLKLSRTEVMRRVTAERDRRSGYAHDARLASLEADVGELKRIVAELQRRANLK